MKAQLSKGLESSCWHRFHCQNHLSSLLVAHGTYVFFFFNIKKSVYMLIRWMGEKYDGIRACWNFLEKKL